VSSNFPSLLVRLASAGVLLALLAACGGAPGVRPQINPPSLSIQELRVLDDGSWSLSLRLQNFSNVVMRMDSIEARLEIAGQEAARLSLRPGLDVPANSAEILQAQVTPDAQARQGLEQALNATGSVRYQFKGRIRSSEPRVRNDEFEFSSLLNRTPGLEGVLR